MSDEYKTSDLALASYLIIRGHEFLGLEDSLVKNGRQGFRFEKNDLQEADIMLFINRRASVEPCVFLDQMKTLKAQCHQR